MQENIYLNVYDIHPINNYIWNIGLGTYHSAIEIYKKEYTFNKNGIIIIDDYRSGPPNGCIIDDVTRACDDFSKKNQYLEKTEWNCKGKGFCIFKKP